MSFRKSLQSLNKLRTSYIGSIAKRGYLNFASNAPKLKTSPNSLKLSAAVASLVSVGIIAAYYQEEHSAKNDAINWVLVDEIMKHNTLNDCWVAIHGQVFDVSEFLQLHPGGSSRILKFAGGDATKSFDSMHTEDVLKRIIETKSIKLLGSLRGEFKEDLTEEEIAIFENRQRIPSIDKIFNVSDFEFVAKKVLPKSTFFYYATGASDEYSLRENHYAYKRVFFRPKMLQELAEEIDTSTEMMGNKVDIPIYITAFAGAKLAHPLGEYNLQRAAYQWNIMQMVPKQLCFGWDEFMADVPKDQKQWFQLHFQTVQELDEIEETIKKVDSYKTVKGIFINVDVGELGHREKDSKARAESLNDASADILSLIADNGKAKYGAVTWKHLERVRASTNLPIALKGVQRGEDVVLAAEKGINGVILSNHGGRQLDFSRPPLEVLVEARQMLKEKGLEDKIDIYLDGGVRRGSDVIKALCLGAKGVGMGRPFLYAMAGYGEEGVSKLIDLIKTEMVNHMKLLGVDNIKDLNEELVDVKNLQFRSAIVSDSLYDKAYEEMPFPQFRK